MPHTPLTFALLILALLLFCLGAAPPTAGRANFVAMGLAAATLAVLLAAGLPA